VKTPEVNGSKKIFILKREGSKIAPVTSEET